MRDHEFWQEQLNSFVDHQLGPADHTALEEHLNECEACRGQADYLTAMKKRLRAHREVVQMPEAVKKRLFSQIERQQKHSRWMPILSLAASILIFGVLVFSSVGQSVTHSVLKAMPGREVVSANLRGTIVCPDCQIAEEIGCEHGSFCQDGCVPGLLDADGRIWRIARDQNGIAFGKQFMGVYGKQVVLSGDLIFSAQMVRLKSVQTLNETMIGSVFSGSDSVEIVDASYSNPNKLLAMVY